MGWLKPSANLSWTSWGDVQRGNIDSGKVSCLCLPFETNQKLHSQRKHARVSKGSSLVCSAQLVSGSYLKSPVAGSTWIPEGVRSYELPSGSQEPI